jgi:hypothetical protein
MRRPSNRTIAFAAMAAVLTLAGCSRDGDEGNLASLDNQLTNDADPALTSALQDQIAVDPQLVQQSNRNAVRPPETPNQAQYPAAAAGSGSATGPAPANAPGGTAQAGAQLAGAPNAGGGRTGGGVGSSGTGCTDSANFHYNIQWAQRLPAAFPFYPNGRLTEAAANNANGCSTRVITFATADPPQRVLDWYHTRAVRAGYSSGHELREGDHILAGASQTGGSEAFFLVVTPKNNGSDVSLIVNNGR